MRLSARELVAKGHCRPLSLGMDEKAGRVRFSFSTADLPPLDAVNHFLAEYAPPVLDPFCGGGSIPLEAQRLGLRAYGSDLNPVPVLVTKALIEIPPRFSNRPPVNPEWQARTEAQRSITPWRGAHGLAEDVRYYGQWVRSEAERRTLNRSSTPIDARSDSGCGVGRERRAKETLTGEGRSVSFATPQYLSTTFGTKRLPAGWDSR